MAIKDTIQWLETQIPEKRQRDAIRKRFGKVRSHKIVYPRNWIEEELTELIKKSVFNRFQKAHPGMYPSTEQVLEFVSVIGRHTWGSYQHTYNNDNMYAQYAIAGLKKTTITIDLKGRDKVVRFATNTGEDFEGFVHWMDRTKVNHASRLLLADAARELIRRIKNDPATKKANKNNLAQSIVAGRDRGAKDGSGVLNQIGQGNQNRLHGAPIGDLNPDYPEHDDTTISLLGFEENIYATQSGQIDSDVELFMKSQGSQQPLYESVMKEIEGKWFDEEWKVNNKKFSDIKKFRDKIEIIILMGAASKNPLMRYADADGIAEYLATIRDSMISSLEESNLEGWAERASSKQTPRQRMNEVVVSAAIEPIVEKLKKNTKLKVTTKGIKKAKRTNQTTKGKKNIAKAGREKGGRVTKPKKSAKAKIRTASRSKGRKVAGGGASPGDMNPIGLQQLLNKALPEEVAKNMGSPALNYRTGRFAGSAQVTQVVPMPKSVEIRYDYQQDPYSVFEPGSGSPLATARRDPRAIIGGTIRELAQSIMGNKYGLVRTKRV